MVIFSFLTQVSLKWDLLGYSWNVLFSSYTMEFICFALFVCLLDSLSKTCIFPAFKHVFPSTSIFHIDKLKVARNCQAQPQY